MNGGYMYQIKKFPKYNVEQTSMVSRNTGASGHPIPKVDKIYHYFVHHLDKKGWELNSEKCFFVS